MKLLYITEIDVAILYILPRLFPSITINSKPVNNLKRKKTQNFRPSVEEIADGFVCFAQVINFAKNYYQIKKKILMHYFLHCFSPFLI